MISVYSKLKATIRGCRAKSLDFEIITAQLKAILICQEVKKKNKTSCYLFGSGLLVMTEPGFR